VAGHQAARVWYAIVLAAALCCLPAPAAGQTLGGSVAAEIRAYPRTPVVAGQRQANVSVKLAPEYEWVLGDQRIVAAPFARWDQTDAARTHWDVRELLWEYAADAWEIRAGIGRVFWGVTESQHLVDIVNQTDFVENLDGEDKLGQPMVQLGLFPSWGIVDVFVLPGFRTRTFPGRSGRPQFPLPVAVDDAVFESPAGRKHVDVAVRWSGVLGPVDLGVSHFHGTGREPRFVAGADASGTPAFVPHYDQIDQTGVDLSWVTGAWLWKLEAINRASDAERFAALTGGFEYTLSGVFGSRADLGLLTEYLWDERGRLGQNPFDDEVFLASRLGLNDIEDSQLLSGVAVDRHTGASFVTIEGSRRVGDRWRISLEGRSFFHVPAADILYSFRADDYLSLELERFF